MFVARISENALAAVSLAFPVQMVMGAIAVGTGVGVNACVSRFLGMGDRAVAGLAHALHIDVDEIAQARHQLGHVDARAAVDGRGVFASEDGCMHDPIVSQLGVAGPGGR